MAQHYTPIWDDWFEVTQELNAQEKGRLIDALVAYDNGGDWQDQIKGNERYVFPGFKARIDRWQETCDSRKQAKANDNKIEQKNQNATKISESNKTHKDNDKDNVLKETTLTSGKEKRVRFSPPTLEEVSAYCKERGNRIDPQYFVDYYEARGWELKPGQKVKDWKACVRTWEQRDQQPQKPKLLRAQMYEQREYKEEEMRKLLGVDDLFKDEVAG